MTVLNNYLKGKLILNDLVGKDEKLTNDKGEYETLDNLIMGITSMSAYALNFQKTQEKTIDGICFKTTAELNDKLADTPENKSTWDRIYNEIPPYVLTSTLRHKTGDLNHLFVFGNYRTSFEKIEEYFRSKLKC